MTLLQDELLGVQVPSLMTLPLAVVSNAAEEAVALADRARLTLDPWQVTGLESMLGERVDGTWAAFESAVVTQRQNGKGGILEARELAGLFLFDELDIIHSAHEAKTSKEAFRRMERIIRSSPDLFRRVGDDGFKRSNEETSITVRDTGARIRYLTRSSSGGRGFTADVVVLDEAFNLPGEMIAAILPTIMARPNSQVIYTSSAGLSTSVILWGLRKRALAGGEPRLAYCEWGAEDVSLDEEGKVVSVAPDPDDRAAWARANPALGYRITEEAIEVQQRAMAAVPGKFERECLGVWDPVPEDTDERPVKLPADKWKATGISRARALRDFPGSAKTVAFEVTKDGEWSSITVGNGSIQAPYVETIEHRRGVGWLPQRLVELVHDHDPIAVGCNGAGHAGAQVGAVLLAFVEADPPIDVKILKQFGAAEYKQACGGFYTDVIEGRVKRPAEGQGPLDNAAADAAERPLSGGFAWDSRDVTVPLSPLSSATIARALLPVEKPKGPPPKARIHFL